MSEKFRSSEGTAEKGSRYLRNFNAAVGAVALAGAAVVAPPAAVALGAYAGFNFLQAGGFEAGRRWTKKKRRKQGK